MPTPGRKLAPPPSDIEVVAASGAPQDVTTPFDESMEAQFAGGFDRWTSAEARRAGANRVTHTGSPEITLYDHLGNDRTVKHEDLLIVTDPAMPKANRLYVRCPKCQSLPNQGIHTFSGPNACPGKEALKFMACPVCVGRGVNKRVYEQVLPMGANVGEDDPNYVEANLPGAASRTDQLRELLGLHMTAFHQAEARQLYGVRREPSGNGFRIIWERD